jgi:hypothetical protein
MSSTNKGASATTSGRRSQALASFYTLNPGIRQSPYGGSGGQEHAAKVAGLRAAPCCSPVLCTPPGPITGLVAGCFDSFPCGGNNSPGDPFYYDIVWNAVPGVSSYTITSTQSDTSLPSPPDNIVFTGPTSATVYTINNDGNNRIITVTANTPCGSSSATQTINPCFLAGSLVQMADGSTKVIEEVQVGDRVLGAFGEINDVLALHRPLLGPVATMCNINGEHSTTNHHPHISIDRQFYCGDPALVSATTYGREHDVIDETGATVKRLLHGLSAGRIQKLETGVNLKTVDGARVVATLELYPMPPETQLYNLVIGGSHTYHVDGYAVTGWPREDDFDYDTWTSIA